MSYLEAVLVARFLTFVLVLGRVSGVVMTAPIFGANAVPRQVRALLAVALALLITPLQPIVGMRELGSLAEIGRLLASEVLVGLLLGLSLTILFAGIQVAGQIVSQMSGMSLADVFNPGFDENVSVFSQLFYFLALAVFVAIGGHRLVLEALLDTYLWAPPGTGSLGENFVDVIISIVTQSFALGIRAVAPVMAALLLSTLVLGLISRTLPQINIIVVGFNLNAMLTLGSLLLTIGTISWTFQEQTAETLNLVLELFRNS